MSLIKARRTATLDAEAKDIKLPFIITFNNGKKEFREGYSEEEVRRRFDKSIAALYGGIKSVKLEDEDRRNGKDSRAAGDATTRKFNPNDIVEWRDAHGRHNSAFYVRENGDRVTVSIEKNGHGGGLEIPKEWITNSRAADASGTDANFKVGDKVKLSGSHPRFPNKVAVVTRVFPTGFVKVKVDGIEDIEIAERLISKAEDAAEKGSRELQNVFYGALYALKKVADRAKVEGAQTLVDAANSAEKELTSKSYTVF